MNAQAGDKPHLSLTRSVCHYLAAVTSFDAVSDSTSAAVVTEIDEDSAFTKAPIVFGCC